MVYTIYLQAYRDSGTNILTILANWDSTMEMKVRIMIL